MIILIYDSDCNMCSSFIQFIVKRNKNKNLRITGLQSNWTKKNLQLDTNIDSIIFIDSQNKKFYYSSAIIKLFSELQTAYRFLSLLLVIPKPIRDYIYKYIARRRKKISNKFNCPIPSKKFLSMYLK
ncbi:thiol-disulfide oxidoreductase DCC family protein [Halalkalibacter sp. AB-rgal2]|uniref:thiol-disulfide oxidoreductase DCC family protein n=1 Tax=Halalkalibacter TaxID=2893056 RepID=UPI000557CEFF